MKKVLSIILVLSLVVSMVTIIPAMAADDVISTVKLAGPSVNPSDPVNIILTDKTTSKIKYLNQVKPDEDGSWRLNFQVEGTLGDYNLLFRQNNTVTSEIGPEFIASITSGMEINLSAIVAARTVVANLNVKNPDLENTYCNVIIAAYDENGNLINSISPKVDIDEETIAEEITHNLPDNAKYAKVFCWYNFIEPLTKAQKAEPMTKYIENRGSVGNVFAKLNNGENVNIVYLGGSVTVGTGLPDFTYYGTKSWRGLTMEWFKSKYPGQVNFYNSAVGGTGSFFGAVRTAKDVLSYNPDLVFIMYPINDVYDGMTKEETQRQMEDIICQIREADADTDIIMGYDTDKYKGATEGNYDMVTWQEEVAEAYDISIINMGLRLADYVRDTGTDWSALLSDQVHPNEAGYRLYADVALSFLEEARLDAPDAVSDYVLPAQRIYGTAMNPYLVKAADKFISGEDTQNNYNSLYSDKYVLAAGDTFTFDISGDSVGIVVKQIYAYDIDLSYDIDGSKGTTDVGNKQIIKLMENCGNENHTVTITNDSTTNIEILAAFTYNAD